MPPHQVVLLIGGNQGDRLQLLAEARQSITRQIGSISGVSKIYETEPWGFVAEQNFLNQGVLVDTSLSPLEVLDKALAIEADLGRVRLGQGYTSRPMDIDLIFFDHEVINSPRLTLPHPRMHLRRFVLKPLNDLIPEYVHPLLHKSIRQLLAECSDEGLVKDFEG